MMMKLILLIILLSPVPSLFAEDAVLSWDPSPDSDVTGYQVYRGTASGQYIESVDVGNTTTHTFSALTAGVHYFAVTAYNASGSNSSFSNEVFKEISGGSTLASPGGGGGGCTIRSDGEGTSREAAEMLLLIAVILFLAAKKLIFPRRRSSV